MRETARLVTSPHMFLLLAFVSQAREPDTTILCACFSQCPSFCDGLTQFKASTDSEDITSKMSQYLSSKTEIYFSTDLINKQFTFDASILGKSRVIFNSKEESVIINLLINKSHTYNFLGFKNVNIMLQSRESSQVSAYSGKLDVKSFVTDVFSLQSISEVHIHDDLEFNTKNGNLIFDSTFVLSEYGTSRTKIIYPSTSSLHLIAESQLTLTATNQPNLPSISVDFGNTGTLTLKGVWKQADDDRQYTINTDRTLTIINYCTEIPFSIKALSVVYMGCTKSMIINGKIQANQIICDALSTLEDETVTIDFKKGMITTELNMKSGKIDLITSVFQAINPTDKLNYIGAMNEKRISSLTVTENFVNLFGDYLDNVLINVMFTKFDSDPLKYILAKDQILLKVPLTSIHDNEFRTKFYIKNELPGFIPNDYYYVIDMTENVIEEDGNFLIQKLHPIGSYQDVSRTICYSLDASKCSSKVLKITDPRDLLNLVDAGVFEEGIHKYCFILVDLPERIRFDNLGNINNLHIQINLTNYDRKKIFTTKIDYPSNAKTVISKIDFCNLQFGESASFPAIPDIQFTTCNTDDFTAKSMTFADITNVYTDISTMFEFNCKNLTTYDDSIDGNGKLELKATSAGWVNGFSPLLVQKDSNLTVIVSRLSEFRLKQTNSITTTALPNITIFFLTEADTSFGKFGTNWNKNQINVEEGAGTIHFYCNGKLTVEDYDKKPFFVEFNTDKSITYTGGSGGATKTFCIDTFCDGEDITIEQINESIENTDISTAIEIACGSSQLVSLKASVFNGRQITLSEFTKLDIEIDTELDYSTSITLNCFTDGSEIKLHGQSLNISKLDASNCVGLTFDVDSITVNSFGIRAQYMKTIRRLSVSSKLDIAIMDANPTEEVDITLNEDANINVLFSDGNQFVLSDTMFSVGNIKIKGLNQKAQITFSTARRSSIMFSAESLTTSSPNYIIKASSSAEVTYSFAGTWNFKPGDNVITYKPRSESETLLLASENVPISIEASDTVVSIVVNSSSSITGTITRSSEFIKIKTADDSSDFLKLSIYRIYTMNLLENPSKDFLSIESGNLNLEVNKVDILKGIAISKINHQIKTTFDKRGASTIKFLNKFPLDFRLSNEITLNTEKFVGSLTKEEKVQLIKNYTLVQAAYHSIKDVDFVIKFVSSYKNPTHGFNSKSEFWKLVTTCNSEQPPLNEPAYIIMYPLAADPSDFPVTVCYSTKASDCYSYEYYTTDPNYFNDLDSNLQEGTRAVDIILLSPLTKDHPINFTYINFEKMAVSIHGKTGAEVDVVLDETNIVDSIFFDDLTLMNYEDHLNFNSKKVRLSRCSFNDISIQPSYDAKTEVITDLYSLQRTKMIPSGKSLTLSGCNEIIFNNNGWSFVKDTITSVTLEKKTEIMIVEEEDIIILTIPTTTKAQSIEGLTINLIASGVALSFSKGWDTINIPPTMHVNTNNQKCIVKSPSFTYPAIFDAGANIELEITRAPGPLALPDNFVMNTIKKYSLSKLNDKRLVGTKSSVSGDGGILLDAGSLVEINTLKVDNSSNGQFNSLKINNELIFDHEATLTNGETEFNANGIIVMNWTGNNIPLANLGSLKSLPSRVIVNLDDTTVDGSKLQSLLHTNSYRLITGTFDCNQLKTRTEFVSVDQYYRNGEYQVFDVVCGNQAMSINFVRSYGFTPGGGDDQGGASKKPSNDTGKIVGITVACVVVVAAVIIIVMYFTFRKRFQARLDESRFLESVVNESDDTARATDE